MLVEISLGNIVPESSMCTFSQLSRRTSADLLKLNILDINKI